MIIGSHVSISGKDMFLNSVREALSYGSDTFMIYTGAPQNTKRKDISELHIPEGRSLMAQSGMAGFLVHAPYIINMANTVNARTAELALEFLQLEISRTQALGSPVLIVHPGAHVGAGVQAGIRQIIWLLNEILSADTPCFLALETMAGKGSEIGSRFEELAAVYDGVVHSEKLRVCLDTCHVHDSGYDITGDFDGVIREFDRLIGQEQIAVIHLNDSKNPRGARKDRHENIGRGCIGFDALYRIAHHPAFAAVPKILETPYVPSLQDPRKKLPPYKEEIEMLRTGQGPSVPA